MLSDEVANLEGDFETLKVLTGEILATMQIPANEKEFAHIPSWPQFKELIAKWNARFQVFKGVEIVATVEVKNPRPHFVSSDGG